MLIILGLYVGIVCITHATQHFYTYAFMDPSRYSRAGFAGHILGIGAGITGLFVLARYRIWFSAEDDRGKTREGGYWEEGMMGRKGCTLLILLSLSGGGI